jgi:Thioesterase-like superfamily
MAPTEGRDESFDSLQIVFRRAENNPGGYLCHWIQNLPPLPVDLSQLDRGEAPLVSTSFSTANTVSIASLLFHLKCSFQVIIMGIVHTPRVLATIVKGFMKQSSNPNIRSRIGLTDPHLYRARAGLVDYAFGHLNNAAFLYHAEYARWAMTAENGWLNAMIKNKAMMIVVAQSCRYRAEIKPFFRRFEVESTVLGMDDRNMWL